MWQYHRPGMSHQAEFGYPDWGDKPTMQFPNGVPCSWNTVVMWTDKKDETENWHHEQATPHLFPHISPLYSSAMYHLSPLPHRRVQLDVEDTQQHDGLPVILDYNRNDNAIELLKVPYRYHFLYR